LNSINTAATSLGGEVKEAAQSPTEWKNDVVVIFLFCLASLVLLPFSLGWLASEINNIWLVVWHTGYLFSTGSVITMVDAET
jgi:hypothetical protein